MNFHRLLAIAPLLAGLFAMPQAARAAQSYDNCSGFIDTLPATISTQGVWCLRHDLATAITSGSAITIATNNVTIDCNDFKIGGLAAGPASTAKGIYANDRQNATVRHCNVRGFYHGIDLFGAGHLVEDNRLDNNLYIGLRITGDQILVQRNRVFATGGTSSVFSFKAYAIYSSGDIIDNLVDGVFAIDADASPYGIMLTDSTAEVRGNRVRNLAASGSGSARGIVVLSGDGNRIVDNLISQAVPTAGTGIYGATTNYCSRNTVVNFSTAMDACVNDGGNALH